MQVTLIGLGGETFDTLTQQAREALENAPLILGAKRLLEHLPKHDARKVSAVRSQEILDLLQAAQEETACVVFSGDTGFYSGAKGLLPLLEQAGIPARVLPGLSSVQLFAARLGRPWQDWRLCSAHGVELDPVAEVLHGRPVFFLTGGILTPQSICRRFVEVGLGDLPVTVGENLSYPEEKVCSGTAQTLAEETFALLSVLLAEPAPTPKRRAPGIPDAEFLRDKVPMTKQEVRAAVLAKLAVGPEDLCWDVGAGTGSVSVELALHSQAVWAIEHKAEACELIRCNREKFCAWNLRVVEGHAPEALHELPAPDVVFLGGTDRKMPEILQVVRAKNPKARVCISAIALETLHQAVEELTALGHAPEITQIAVSRAKAAGDLHLLLAQNPIFLISAGGDA